jgi:hypothetical protein
MIMAGIVSRMPAASTNTKSASVPLLPEARWAEAEFGSIALHDARCRRRLVRSFAGMLAAPGESIPQCTGSTGAARAFYRLLDHDELTDTLIFDTHRAGVLRRAGAVAERVLLAIQDTTTLNFDRHKSLEGLGAIGANNTEKSVSGLLVHSTLLTAADSDQVYGLLGAKIYTRDPDKRKSQAPGTRNREPIAEKESIRWLESFALARDARQTLCASGGPEDPAVLVVSVGDREADIYELLLEARQHRAAGVGLLVRSQYNRGLTGGEKLLWEELSGSPLLGTVSLPRPRSQGQKPRTAVLEIRRLRVEIAVPAHKEKYLHMDTPVTVHVIELTEQGEKDGICWRLVTTLPVEDAAAAARLARWYAKRWQIEEYHRILKTGCRVESRQLRTLGRLRPMLALDMIVACCVMGLRAAARDTPEAPASTWLDDDEIKALTAWSRPQRPAPAADGKPLTIGEAVRLIGRLGGHLGRKSDGAPGPEVLWRGLAKLDAITEAWRRFYPDKTCG